MKQLLILLGTILLTSCGPYRSSDIDAANMNVELNVEATSSYTATCFASFKAYDQFVELTGEDEIYCNGVKMERTTRFNSKTNRDVDIAYIATIPISDGEEVNFRFDHKHEVYNSRVELPIFPNIIYPRSGQFLPKDSSIKIQWINESPQCSSITLSTNYVSEEETNISKKLTSCYDPGTRTFESFEQYKVGKVPMKISIKRSEVGNLDFGLNGDINATNEATLYFYLE